MQTSARTCIQQLMLLIIW